MEKTAWNSLNLLSLKIVEKNGPSNMWLGGDFNLSDVDWKNWTVPKYANKSTLCQHLIKLATKYSLSQMINEPTHHLDDSDILIDLFLTSNPSLVQNVYHMPGLWICKHDVLMVQIDISPQRSASSPRKIYMFKKMDQKELTRDAEEFCSSFFDSKPTGFTVEQNWTTFKDQVIHLMEKHLPTKVIRPCKDLAWMTRELKHKIRQKNKWYKKTKETNSTKVWSKYKTHMTLVGTTSIKSCHPRWRKIPKFLDFHQRVKTRQQWYICTPTPRSASLG